jgi:hypothetical protein
MANSSDPIITSIPNPAPRIVGQSVPELGRVGVVGIGVGTEVAPGQVQFVTVGHDLSRQ